MLTQLEIRCSKGGGGTMQLTKALPLSNLVYLTAKKMLPEIIAYKFSGDLGDG